MIEVFYDGKPCVNLPGSTYYVTSEGTLINAFPLSLHVKRPGYKVTRKGTRKYYSKEQLKDLYKKFRN